MLRGLITGGLTGVVVGGAGLTIASLALELPAGNIPPAPPQTTTESTATAPDLDMTAPDAVEETVTSAPDTAAPTSPDPTDVTPELGNTIADLNSADVPATATIEGGFTNPEIAPAPAIDVSNAAPVLPNPASVAPSAPVTEQGVTLSTEPAAAPKRAPRDQSAIIVPDDSPQQPFMPDFATGNGIVNDYVDVIDPSIGDFNARFEDPEIVTAPSDGLDFDEVPPELRAPNLDTDTAPDDQTVFPEGTPALVRYAATDVPEVGDKSRVAVLLLDTGVVSGAVEAVAALGFPATVIIDPAVPNAAAKATAYREAGIEVGLRTLLPDVPTVQDVEVSLAATLALVPEAVILLDAGEGGLQNRQDAVQQAMYALSEDGLGFVSVSKGLNTAMRIAEKSDVPSALIFRDLDADGQDATVIRRFIDQAAFRARRDGQVVLLGRVRADTLGAFVLWQSGRRAQDIALVPITNLLAPDQDPVADISPDAQPDPDAAPDQN